MNTYIIIYCDPNQVGQQDIQSLVRTLGLDYQLEEEDIQDMYNDQTFSCARFYYGWGHDLGVRGCNGCSIDDYADIPHGMDLGKESQILS